MKWISDNFPVVVLVLGLIASIPLAIWLRTADQTERSRLLEERARDNIEMRANAQRWSHDHDTGPIQCVGQLAPLRCTAWPAEGRPIAVDCWRDGCSLARCEGGR